MNTPNANHPTDRAIAIRWAQRMLIEGFVILDTETTGLLKDQTAQIVQLAAIDHNGEVLINGLLKPACPIPSDAIAIHGITNEMVADAPGFDAYWIPLSNATRGKNVIIYNAEYDCPMIGRHIFTHKGNVDAVSNWFQKRTFHCAMLQYAAFFGEPGRFGEYKWQRLPSEGPDAHTALGDCRAVLQLITRMAEGS